MIKTPNANRLHIAIFGKRNVGKSSLINAITNQNIALVSDIPGTTTDPVYKAMELLPIGPVVIIDTAGLDDEGTIGELRIKKALQVMDKTDLALLVFNPENSDISMELEWHKELVKKNIPVIGVINKIDEHNSVSEIFEQNFDIPFVKVSAKDKTNITVLKETIFKTAPVDYENKTIVGDIIKEKDLVILVAPQDIQAPKGRLILPQVQIIRDILDNDALALTVKDSELEDLLKLLNKKPDLVITDSQIFDKVNKIIPSDIKLTSFSILMAKYKGDINSFVDGAKAIESLKPGDKVLIAESCTHHALKNDIAREKLPKWLEKKAGGPLEIKISTGTEYPENLNEYKLIVHCGGCMTNRKDILSRINKAEEKEVPITNFGTAIAYLNGIIDRITY